VVSRSSPRFYGGGRFVNVRPVRFYRPYYTFRPRISLGFGLWVGFPIAYPSYYGYYDPYYDPYGYPYPVTSYPAYPPPAYPPAGYPPSAYPPSAYPPSAYPPSADPRSGYPPSGSVQPQGPNQANTGGVSFEITPSTAEVFVDGEYVGTVSQFTPTSEALGLTPGRHHLEIRAAGYRTLDLDADIVAGQVIPYQGTLQR
jgi:PEGA domain